MDDVVKEFLIESYENLDRLERDLVRLEQEPGDREVLASIFRTFHTIKGTSGFLGFVQLESLTHVGENLLSKMRDGDLALSPAITSALLALGDAVRAILANIENCGDEGEADHAALQATLTQLQAGVSSVRPAPVFRATGPSAAAAPTPEPARAAVGGGSIRVDVRLLDKLMNLVGELVLARNQVLQYTATQNDAAFLGTSQRLNLITSELQEGVMKTRMQPIGGIWGKLPRVVRDLSLVCKKQVRVEMEGTETELDKTIIEAIKDPLTHLVRNAVDHGIEAPDERARSGKPVEGRLLLRAYHEGGQVNIEIADDGAGIDGERVKSKALERGLISAEQAARLGERELMNLIFLPGFSTAASVTNVSGRGVGMDVVKTNIERIGGTVEVSSTAGRGTTHKLKIPLTLAIIPALTVTAAGERYAIPQVNLLELVRLKTDAALDAPPDGGHDAARDACAENARGGVELIHGVPVYRLRGRLLPLVYLARELQGSPRGFEPGERAPRPESTHVVVLQAEERQFGLVVDEVNDTEEIVVKPLGRKLKGIPVFAGATIMGDGRVALARDRWLVRVLGAGPGAAGAARAASPQAGAPPRARGR